MTLPSFNSNTYYELYSFCFNGGLPSCGNVKTSKNDNNDLQEIVIFANDK